MKREKHIHIGEYYASKEPTVIKTVLGSCVAVCLFDPFARLGGMNHILMPGRADLHHFNADARYGIHAMELLINRIMKCGGVRSNLRSKVFGGGHVIPAISRERGPGVRNIAFVLEFLKVEGIPLMGQDVGGKDARRVLFHTDTGEVFVQRIPSAIFSKIGEEETNAVERISSAVERPGDITLFEP